MHRVLVTLLSILMLAALAPCAYGTGTISGLVTDISSQNLDGIDVQVFNAINAVLVADALTGANGPGFFSIPVPGGQYRVRFSGGKATNGGCYAGGFYSTDGSDSFDLGLVVTVADGANTQVDRQLASLPKLYVNPCYALLVRPKVSR
jgi:hypothetical protein